MSDEDLFLDSGSVYNREQSNPNRKPMAKRYTVEAGRAIYRNGKRFVYINRDGDTQPTDANTVVYAIVRSLNNLARKVCPDCKQTKDIHHYSCPRREGNPKASKPSDDPNFLFTLRVPVKHFDESVVGRLTMVVIHAFDGGHQPPNHTRIDIEVRFAGETIFKRGDTWCGTPGCIDGNEAKELVLATVAIKPGDTDSDYFEHYTTEQLEFVQTYGEDLGMMREHRYCDENGNVKFRR